MKHSSHDASASLILIKDLIERHPAEKREILRHEIHWREREQMQFRGIRRLMHVQAWMSFRTVFFVGVTVFLFVFTLGQFAGLARWVQGIQDLALDIPTSLQQGLGFSAKELVPTSTAMELAARLPTFSLLQSGVIALVVVLGLLFWKGYNTYFLLRQAHALRVSQRELQEEIDVLESWGTGVDEQAKKG